MEVIFFTISNTEELIQQFSGGENHYKSCIVTFSPLIQHSLFTELFFEQMLKTILFNPQCWRFMLFS